MSLSSEQFDDGRRPSGSRPLPIACRVCNRIFFDNVSLVLHFDSHVKDGIRLSGKNLASMRGGQHSSASWSPYSRSPLPRMNEALRVVPIMNDARSVVPRMNDARRVVPRMNDARRVAPRMNDARGVVFSKTGDYFRPCPPVNHPPRDPNHLYIPVVNVSRPIHHPIMGQDGATSSSPPIMGQDGATSSSPRPLMDSQSGARNFGYGPYGLVAPPHLRSRVARGQNGGQTQFANNIPPIRQHENPIPASEIIILSDDEDCDKSKTKIDLALKL